MDFLTPAVMIVLITAATVVVIVKVLASTPARIAAVLGAVAVLFGVLPRLFAPLPPTPSPPAPTSTFIMAPDGPDGSAHAPSTSPTTVLPETPRAGDDF